MSYHLPPNLLRLFQPRPPLPARPASKADRDPRQLRKKTRRPLTGLASTLDAIQQERADAGLATVETEEGEEAKDEEGNPFTDTVQTRRELKREQRQRRIAETRQRGLATYAPQQDPQAQGDAFSTLFVSRLAYSLTEEDLRSEFEMYGPIQRIRLVRDRQGRSRGYAFIVYERERDMRAAYKDAEGIKILGRRAMVDVERGRTVKDWKPMRLGGGLGGLARKKRELPPHVDPAFAMVNGGLGRGGFRGGFRGGGGRGGGGYRGGGRMGGPPMGGYGGPPSGPPAAGYGPPSSNGGDGYGGPNKRGRY